MQLTQLFESFIIKNHISNAVMLLLSIQKVVVEHYKFEGLGRLRVLNPEGANGWEILKASNHKAVWKSFHPWCSKFGLNIEVVPVRTDSEFLEDYDEINS